MELAVRRSCSISARCRFAELNNNNIAHPQRQETVLRRRDSKEEAAVPHGKAGDLCQQVTGTGWWHCPLHPDRHSHTGDTAGTWTIFTNSPKLIFFFFHGVMMPRFMANHCKNCCEHIIWHFLTKYSKFHIPAEPQHLWGHTSHGCRMLVGCH